MKILVTGGLGFIGSAFVRLLISKSDYEVHVVDDLSTGTLERVLDGVTYHFFDVCDSDALRALFSDHQFSGIFHFAALPRILPSFITPLEHDRVNIGGTLSVLDCFIKQTQKDCILINSSSSAVYGDPEKYPTSEISAVSPKNPYALQKYTSEQYVSLLAKYHEKKSISLRYFNPYGPGSFSRDNPLNAYSSVVGIWLEALKNDEPLIIYGDGTQRRDFIHVADVAEVNYRCFRRSVEMREINAIYNVGSGYSLSLNQLVDYIRRCKPVKVIYKQERSGEAKITCADTSRLREFIGELPLQDIFSYLKESANAES